MEESPFRYHGPLDPQDVTGRDDLLADLGRRVTERRVTALLGPRRYGKTSVLRRLAADLTEVTTIWLDLYGATTMTDLALALDAALTAADPPVARSARDTAATFEINLGMVRASLARRAASRPDPDVLFLGLLDTLVSEALRRPTLLVLDEFSAIARSLGAMASLRTKLQHHYTDIGIVFAGSAPSTMRALFADRAEPFFAQADLVTIPPLALASTVAIVDRGFTETGRGAGQLAGLIASLTGGHPQRTMQLADACWRRTPEAAVADAATWATALDDVRLACADPSARLFDHYRRNEQLTLRIVAARESPHGAAGALLGLNKNAATRAVKSLLDDGDLLRDDDGLVVTDPLFADWLRETLSLP